MVKCKHVPEILIQWQEKSKTLIESEKVLNTLMENPDLYSEEIAYMKDSICTLTSEMDDDRDEVMRILNSLRFDIQASIYARLHYFCALPWDEVARYVGNGSSTEEIRERVYRAFKNVNSEKAIRRIAQLSDEI